jgi:hypothetical protein
MGADRVRGFHVEGEELLPGPFEPVFDFFNGDRTW